MTEDVGWWQSVEIIDNIPGPGSGIFSMFRVCLNKPGTRGDKLQMGLKRIMRTDLGLMYELPFDKIPKRFIL